VITRPVLGGRTWVCDFEFSAESGHRPKVWCGVFFCLETQDTIRLTFDRPDVPCPVDPEKDTVVAYFASAEITCFLALDWPVPLRVIDLYPECKVVHGAVPPKPVTGWSLLDMATAHGIATIEAEQKTYFREIAIRGPVTPTEWAGLVEYCETDVVATAKLYEKLVPRINHAQALLRGAYVVAVSRMEHNGTPIDFDTWARISAHWSKLLDRQTERVNQLWPVYRRNKAGEWTRSFELWQNVMASRGIKWPHTECGRPATDSDTLKDMTNRYPELRPLRELETARGHFRLGLELAIGPDSRNRCLLSPFSTVTSRGAPSNARFIFGPSVWLRSLIQAPPGRCLIYSDLSAAEIGIAGALSGDPNLSADYAGDPYLAFAHAAGLVPANATKKTHGTHRDLAKRLLLAVNYGMGINALARSLELPVAQASHLMAVHKNRYRKFWAWVDDVQATVTAGRALATRFGWRWLPGRDSRNRPDYNPRRAQNWPAQATCAEILRLAAVRLSSCGVAICCPVHDALLVEGPAESAEVLADQVKAAWVDASRDTIGVPLKSDATILRPGERYSDPRGAETWESVMALLVDLEQEAAALSLYVAEPETTAAPP
jgi:DNA polymerase-1